MATGNKHTHNMPHYSDKYEDPHPWHENKLVLAVTGESASLSNQKNMEVDRLAGSESAKDLQELKDQLSKNAEDSMQELMHLLEASDGSAKSLLEELSTKMTKEERAFLEKDLAGKKLHDYYELTKTKKGEDAYLKIKDSVAHRKHYNETTSKAILERVRSAAQFGSPMVLALVFMTTPPSDLFNAIVGPPHHRAPFIVKIEKEKWFEVFGFSLLLEKLFDLARMKHKKKASSSLDDWWLLEEDRKHFERYYALPLSEQMAKNTLRAILEKYSLLPVNEQHQMFEYLFEVRLEALKSRKQTLQAAIDSDTGDNLFKERAKREISQIELIEVQLTDRFNAYKKDHTMENLHACETLYEALPSDTLASIKLICNRDFQIKCQDMFNDSKTEYYQDVNVEDIDVLINKMLEITESASSKYQSNLKNI
ncbi:MAG: hypothetical protein AB7F64_06370 [Gammaproteobacteria bacterium]